MISKKNIMTALLALMVSLGTGAQSLFVGSYNIRNKNDNDSIAGNVWSVRSRVICDQINFEQPDVFGTQECFVHQLKDMTNMLDGYEYVGVAREDGKENGEYSAIFYKSERFDLKHSGDFWLSEHPDRPGLGWDAACTRICTWGELCDKATGFTFFFFNLHMDHVGIVARRESAKLVVRKIKEIAGNKAPVILTGDFNVDQTNEIYRIFTESGILKDSYTCARLRFAENGTFNGFDSTLKTDSRIDHIFVSPAFEISNYGVLTNGYWTKKTEEAKSQKSADAPQEIDFRMYDRRTPSDHYPIFARIRYKNDF